MAPLESGVEKSVEPAVVGQQYTDNDVTPLDGEYIRPDTEEMSYTIASGGFANANEFVITGEGDRAIAKEEDGSVKTPETEEELQDGIPEEDLEIEPESAAKNMQWISEQSDWTNGPDEEEGQEPFSESNQQLDEPQTINERIMEPPPHEMVADQLSAGEPPVQKPEGD